MVVRFSMSLIERGEKIILLKSQGLRWKEIGVVMGIDAARVKQILNKYKIRIAGFSSKGNIRYYETRWAR